MKSVQLPLNMAEPESKNRVFAKTLSPVGSLSFLSVSGKRLDRSPPLTNDVINLKSIYLQEYSLTSEFNLLMHRAEPGVYVMPAAKTPFVWFGVMFIRSGLYEGGIFRFRLFIPHTFPHCSVCPKLIFETPVFHPYVNPSTDELFLGNNDLLMEWRKDVNHLWQIISYARSIFYNTSSQNAVNKEAAELYDADEVSFLKSVKNCVENSKLRIYDRISDDDPHYFIFDEYDEEIHQPYRDLLLKQRKKVESNEERTTSWIQLGSLKPLSRLQ